MMKAEFPNLIFFKAAACLDGFNRCETILLILTFYFLPIQKRTHTPQPIPKVIKK